MWLVRPPAIPGGQDTLAELSILILGFRESLSKGENSTNLTFSFFLFAFSRATPTEYGGSQVRDLIRAVAASLC